MTQYLFHSRQTMKTRNYAEVILKKLEEDPALAQAVEEAQKLFGEEESQYLIVNGWRISVLTNPGTDWWIDPSCCLSCDTLSKRCSENPERDRDDAKETKQ